MMFRDVPGLQSMKTLEQELRVTGPAGHPDPMGCKIIFYPFIIILFT